MAQVVPTRQISKAHRMLGIDPSQEKLKRMLGVSDDQLEFALGDAREVFLEVQSKVMDVCRQRAIRCSAKAKKVQRILGIDPSRMALMRKLGVSEKELVSALEESYADLLAQNRPKVDREVVKSLKKGNEKKILDRFGVNPQKSKLEQRLGVSGVALEQAIEDAKCVQYEIMAEDEVTLLEATEPLTDVTLSEPLTVSSITEAEDLPMEVRVALFKSPKLQKMFGMDPERLAILYEAGGLSVLASECTDDCMTDVSMVDAECFCDGMVAGVPEVDEE